MAENYKVAFLGLGVMGFPMAGHLAAGGHDVSVYNRTAAKAETWLAKHTGRSAPTDLRSLVYGDDGAFAGMREGAIFVDHTTASATVARELHAQAGERGIGFLDAPVSGGETGAENGVLTVMVGGDQAAFDKAAPVIDCFARAVTLMGPSGAGQLTKMVNQLCIAGLVQGLAEALNFSERAGLDTRLVLDVISKGAAQSWQMENRGRTMIEGKFDFGFAVDWMRKDLGMCLAEANSNGARLPVAALVDQFYAHIQARGGRRWDTSSLIHLLAND
jgi:3-hydroxyisobutyrate dehydrogenase-like beta-hydroxyacid dehydrogenase